MNHVVVFRSRLRAGVADKYGAHAEAIHDLAIAQPGFVSSKDFIAEDGERIALIEWASLPELEAWRDLGPHRGAQELGRSEYYAAYSLQICSELRGSRFADGVHTRSDHQTRPIAEAWLAAFEARDLDALLALYSENATHTSPKIRERHPDTGGELRGRAAMRAWWQDSFDRLPSLCYIATQITAGPDSVVLEYIRRLDGVPDLPISESFDVRDGRIIRSRVFHG